MGDDGQSNQTLGRVGVWGWGGRVGVRQTDIKPGDEHITGPRLEATLDKSLCSLFCFQQYVHKHFNHIIFFKARIKWIRPHSETFNVHKNACTKIKGIEILKKANALKLKRGDEKIFPLLFVLGRKERNITRPERERETESEREIKG